MVQTSTPPMSLSGSMLVGRVVGCTSQSLPNLLMRSMRSQHSQAGAKSRDLFGRRGNRGAEELSCFAAPQLQATLPGAAGRTGAVLESGEKLQVLDHGV